MLAPLPSHRVFVVATTIEGTTSALRIGHALADTANSNVVLLVPYVSTYPARRAGPDPTALAEQYRTLVSRTDAHASVRVCLCKRVEDIFVQLVHEPSTIVIGGRQPRWLRLSAERRLAHAVASRGHRVVFAYVC